MIGLDTSFLIDFFHGEKNAISWMDQYKDVVCLNENVVYEFLCGNLSDKNKDIFLSFVSQIPVFSFDRNASIKCSDVYRACKRKGETVSHPDVLIGGTYLVNNVDNVVTRNEKDFRKITGLKIHTY